jgi:SAM-dependent methyltransferase
MSVENLYSQWIYPEPVYDLKESISKGWYDFGDPSLVWNLYWPCDLYKPLDILIAGCGTHQAAYYAFKNPLCKVVGIDISSRSLDHQRYLKSKHNLDNLTVEKIDILEIERLFPKKFDLIVSTGVIHHIKDSEKALINLKSCLKTNGRINLMVYGRYPRVGIYMMQEVFKILKLKTSNQDLESVKSILCKLPEWHFVNEYIKKSGDLCNDAGIADTFLNPIDQSYSVNDLLELINRTELEFVDWNDRLHYSIDALVQSDNQFQSLLTDVDEFEKYQLVELLVQQLATHRVILSLKGGNQKILFDKCDQKETVPVLRYDFTFDKMKMYRGHQIIDINDSYYRILCAIDGSNSIKDIINHTDLNSATVGNFIRRLQEFGHLFLTKKSY